MTFRNTIVNIAWSNPSNTLDNTYTYDGNGKILTLNRKGTSNDRDLLTPHYYTNTNRLEYVDDAASSGSYSTDIDDQSAGNYKYTAIGERAKDVEGLIDTITWTVYGKMKALKRHNGDSLIFTYDAMQNRVMKRKKLSTGTETITYYLRDGQGNILSMYDRTTSGGNYLYTQTEVPIYGSDRVGEFKPNILIKTIPVGGTCCGSTCTTCPIYPWTINVAKSNGYYDRLIAKKEYELKDHLGDVHVTVSDRKNTNGTANLLSYTNYYAFGTELTGKTYSSNTYDFGYNGKLKDDDVFNTSGSFYDYGERGLDARGIPLFFTEDPLTEDYPELSPYQYASNTPISAIDLDGLESSFINPVGGVPTTPGDNFRTQEPPADQNKIDPNYKSEPPNFVEATFTAGIGGWYTLLTGESAQTGKPATFGDYVQAAGDVIAFGSLFGGGGKAEPNVTVKTPTPELKVKEAEGVVYKRTDKTGSQKDYIGQAKSESRYKARQKEHQRANKDADYEFSEIDRGKPGRDLNQKEQYHLDKQGGPTNKSNPKGGTSNKKNVIKKQE